MKILHAFDMFTPYGGGIVTVIQKAARALAARGHRVTIYASDYRRDEDFINSMPAGVTVRLFHCRFHPANFFYTPDIRKEAKDQLKRYDIMHLHGYRSYMNLVLSREAAANDVPYLLDSHGTIPRTINGKVSLVSALKYFFDMVSGRNILKNAAGVIAQTRAAYKEYEDYAIPEQKIALIRPPFDTGEFRDLPSPGSFRQAYNLQGKKVVLSLGRIHRIKGLDFLVDTFEKLAATRDDAILVIAGNDDGYRQHLEKKIEKTGLQDKVIFTGFVGGKFKLAALADADVLVQTSLYEYGTGVTYEAILCGTPVIVSRDTIASENIENIDAGYLIPYGDFAKTLSVINHVLDNPEEAADKTSRAAKYIKAELSMDKVAERYEQLYLKVIEEARQKSRG